MTICSLNRLLEISKTRQHLPHQKPLQAEMFSVESFFLMPSLTKLGISAGIATSVIRHHAE